MRRKTVYIAAALALAVFGALVLARGVIVRGRVLRSPSAGEAQALLQASSAAESALYEAASACEKKGDLLKARDAYMRFMEKYPASGSVAKARSEIDRINMNVLFSPVQDTDSFAYEVRPGDTLRKVAKKHDTTVDLLMRSNNMKNGMIKSGRRLKVTRLKFTIVVDKSQNILTLKANGDVFKTYQIATGVNNCTPAGSFKIVTKAVDPVWYSQDAVVPSGSPKNILGTRWMGISQQGYGIHGSTDPASIGKQATAGCIRMHNADVEELYAIVPVGTEVTIEE